MRKRYDPKTTDRLPSKAQAALESYQIALSEAEEALLQKWRSLTNREWADTQQKLEEWIAKGHQKASLFRHAIQMNELGRSIRPPGTNNCGVEPILWLQMTKQEKHCWYTKASIARRGRTRTKEQIAEQNRSYRERFPEKCKQLKENWLAKNKEKAAATIRAWRGRNRERIRKVKAAWRARKAAQTEIKLSPEKVYLLLHRAVPRALPRHVRDDVIAELCLSILEGKLALKHLEDGVRKHLTAYNREYDTFKTLSLDAKIPGMDGMTYLDRLSAEPSE